MNLPSYDQTLSLYTPVFLIVYRLTYSFDCGAKIRFNINNPQEN